MISTSNQSSMRAFLVNNCRKGSRVDAMYSIPLESMGERDVEDEKKRLTLQAKSNFGPPSPPFEVFKVEQGRLYVPRFYGMQRFGPPECDARVLGDPIELQFSTPLREVQRQASSTLFDSYFHSSGICGAMVVLPCGFGKTVLAVSVAAHLGRKTAVLVHTSVLKTQWKESFETFCPGVKVGYVQGSVMDVEGKDVVIMMVQTVAKRQLSHDFTDAFGLLICDEAHHMAAPLMNQALRCFRARYVLALTATKERVDGLTQLLHWCMGPEAFRALRTNQSLSVNIVRYKGAAVEKHTKDGRPLVAIMLNMLAANEQRNRFLAERVTALYKTGRTIIFLSHRTIQLKQVKAWLVSRVLQVPESDVGVLESALNEAGRATQMARPILMCTYNMADEGLDKKQLDTCIMGTPKSRVEQCIGRIQRECESKQEPLVIDVADDGVYYGRLRNARQNFYRKNGYAVEVVDHDAFDPPSPVRRGAD